MRRKTKLRGRKRKSHFGALSGGAIGGIIFGIVILVGGIVVALMMSGSSESQPVTNTVQGGTAPPSYPETSATRNMAAEEAAAAAETAAERLQSLRFDARAAASNAIAPPPNLAAAADEEASEVSISCHKAKELCPPMQSVGDCKRLSRDEQNCGSCGNICPVGASCLLGECECPAGEAICGSACVSPMTDALHCGGCDKKCQPGYSCIAGQCWNGVFAYEHKDFRGKSSNYRVTRPDQYTIINKGGLGGPGNDKISSIEVLPGYEAWLFDDDLSKSSWQKQLTDNKGNVVLGPGKHNEDVLKKYGMADKVSSMIIWDSTKLCRPGWTMCGGKCVMTDRDSNNCGGCGARCPSGLVCMDQPGLACRGPGCVKTSAGGTCRGEFIGFDDNTWHGGNCDFGPGNYRKDQLDDCGNVGGGHFKNDKLSSAWIAPGYCAHMFDDDKYKDTNKVICGDQGLTRHGHKGWFNQGDLQGMGFGNDKLSSLKVWKQ